MTELKLCESCAPEGLSAEEYATRPLVSKCFACGTEATRWYVSAERVLKALLKERIAAPTVLKQALQTGTAFGPITYESGVTYYVCPHYDYHAMRTSPCDKGCPT